MIPGAEPFCLELSTFLNSLKDRFSNVKDLQIGGAGGRPTKGGRGTLLKGSNTADDLCWSIVFLSAVNLTLHLGLRTLLLAK